MSQQPIAQRIAAMERRQDLLLQHLISIQHHDSWVSPEAIDGLSDHLQVPTHQIGAVIDFYTFLHRSAPRGQFDIYLSNNITDQMAGNQALMRRLCDGLMITPGVTRSDGRVTVAYSSCTGMCDQGPAMLVNGLAVTRLTPERIDQICALIEQASPISEWPAPFFEVDENIQQRDLLLSGHLQAGAVLQQLQQQGAVAVLDNLDASALRGRGGAGFATALKWRLCRDAPADDRVVVCNADEGEPGTFKDRVLLQFYADEVIEGMTLCAGVIGASRGFIYLRGEYRYLLEPLQQTLQQRRQQGLLGRMILGQDGFDFDIEIHLGAGAYICGEESALIESLEGKRGMPRKRPPFPVAKGYMGLPTVVNNVETLMAAARITVHGSEWFRSRGTEKSTGTKLVSVSGDCAAPGIYEYPMGVPIATILAACGATETQAVQVAGAAGMTLSYNDFYRCIACEDASTGGSFMVFNRHRDMLDMVRNFAHFFAHESCGFCTPCRVGGQLMVQLVDKLYTGRATQYDLREIERIALVMRHTSHCGLGATASNHIMDTYRNFPDSYQRRLRSSDYEPAFDLDAAVSEAREITGRRDHGAHLGAAS